MPISVCSKTGFSLLEVLVAVMILAFMTSTIWVSLGRSFDVQDQTRKIDGRVHEVRGSLDRIAKDIGMAFLSKNRSADRRTYTIFQGKNAGNTDSIVFTALSHLKIMRSARESEQCEISYYTEKRDDQTVLVRRLDPQLDEDPEEGGTAQVILEDVIEFNLRFYNSQQRSWQEEWDSERNPRDLLPAQVEIFLKYRSHRGDIYAMQTRTLIYMIEPLEI